MKNVDQAIDGGQKEIVNLKSDGDVLGIMDNVVTSLVELGGNIGKDIETAIGKEKAKPVEVIARAILLGNKEVDWVGIVGCLDPAQGITKKDINYKFSKKNFVTEVNKGKDLKGKQAIATKFFDDLQKGIRVELEKSFTDDELKNLYNKMSGEAANQVEFKQGDTVIYLLKDKKKEQYDPKKKPEDQKDIVGVKKIEKIEGDNIFFKTAEGKDFTKTKADIMGLAVTPAAGENAKKAQEALGKIKEDEEKMGKVATFAEFIQNDANKDKIAEIEKILTGGQAPVAQE
jgi:hypothetical protein